MNLGARGGSRFIAVAISFAVAVLSGCGGGGGGGGGSTPPTQVSQTVTCPNGTSTTGIGTTASAAIDAATAQCPAPVLVSVTPSNNATGIAPDTFASLVVTTDSALDPASLTTATVTLKAGQTAVTGTVTADGTKGFKFTPSAKLVYAQAYSFIATVKDTLGKPLAVNNTFTTASVSCVSPLVPDSAGTSCVPPTCTAPAVWDGSACTTPVLRYSEKVYATWYGAQIYAVTKTSVTLVANKTSFQYGIWPINDCMFPRANGIMADGKILVSCVAAGGTLTRHYFALNPVANEITEYAGQVPTKLQCTTVETWKCPADTDWVPTQHFFPQIGAPSGAWAATHVSDGWFFSKDTDTESLYFATNDNNVVLLQKTPFGKGADLRLLMKFSN